MQQVNHKPQDGTGVRAMGEFCEGTKLDAEEMKFIPQFGSPKLRRKLLDHTYSVLEDKLKPQVLT